MNDERNLAVSMRPSTFKEFVGSISTIQQIRTRLESGRVPTAFLLSGPTGTGKTTIARCINTYLKGELIETNAADDTGVDAARRLGEISQHRPLLGEYQVFVLDEAHKLTEAAQNALLKHLEDASSSSLWILCTTDPSKLKATLRRRCVSYTLGGLTPEETKTLALRALVHLGYKRLDLAPDLVDTLVREGVTAPWAILAAVENFYDGADPMAAIYSSADSPSAFAIAQAVAAQRWPTVQDALSKVQNTEAMTIRIVVLNYLKSMLLKNNSNNHFAAEAIKELTATVPAIEALGLTELSARLYTICVDQGRG